jgi:hypothetical protein
VLQQRLYPIAVEDIRRVHYFRFENQTLCIYEQMALYSLHLLLARIVPALSSHDAGALHRLRIDYGCAGLGISLNVRARWRSRRAAFSFSQVPSMRQILK